MPAGASNAAALVVQQLGGSARYQLDDAGLTRTIADARVVEAWAVTTATAEAVGFQAAGRALRVERRADGVWLVDGVASLPLIRSHSADL